jgi:hypothetical protein
LLGTVRLVRLVKVKLIRPINLVGLVR